MAPEPKGYIEASHFSPDALDFIRVLHKHKEIYVTGKTCMTVVNDCLSPLYSDTSENAARLFEALSDFWAGEVPGLNSPEELLEPGIIIQFGRPPNRLDLMNRIDGVTFQEAWESKLSIFIEGESRIPLPMLSLETLIRNKRAAGRAKDSEDLSFLEGKLARRKAI